MDMLFIIAAVAFVVILFCACCRTKRPKPLFSAPVVVTTTQYAQPLPGSQNVTASVVHSVPHLAAGHPTATNVVHQYQYQSTRTAAYPTQPQVLMPMPMPVHTAGATVTSYPMPQPLPTAMPQPTRPYDNPPSYDQVASNSDAYAKQQPYNPNYRPQ